MYNSRQDTKSVRSMTAIKRALVDVMKTHRFHDVTVSALSREAHVSRATFYRFFSTPTDVLEYLCDSIFSEAEPYFAKVDKENHDEYFISLLKYLMEHSDQLETIYLSHHIGYFQKAFSAYIEKHIPNLSSAAFSSGDEEYVRTAIAASFISIIFVWMKRGRKETPETLLRIFKSSITIENLDWVQMKKDYFSKYLL